MLFFHCYGNHTYTPVPFKAFPGNCRALPPTHIFPGNNGAFFDGEVAWVLVKIAAAPYCNISQETNGWYLLSLQGLAPGFQSVSSIVCVC